MAGRSAFRGAFRNLRTAPAIWSSLIRYSNFGVPGLGLKRGLSENVVIAPYATGLAAMVDPHGARKNYARLAEFGASGRYGFYEALDFTRSRLPEGENVAIVRNFMAHHQGMTIVAIANALHDGQMRSRFHREPMIQASELLLQERMPRDVAIAHPRAEEVRASTAVVGTEAPTVRRIAASAIGAPTTHLLSNGRYAVMLTAAGAGYSRWRDIAVTRWREDATRDDWGSFIVLRDVQSGRIWSAGAQPIRSDADDEEVVFDEDRAEFIRRDGALSTTLDVLVSSEDDGEVRRLSLTNSGRRSCEIELTSYAEIVLATPAARQRASGLLQDVRGDRAPRRVRRARRDTPSALARGAAGLGRPFRRRGRRDRSRSAIRDRPGALPGSRPHDRYCRSHRGWPTAFQHRRNRSRPYFLAAAHSQDSAWQGRAGHFLDRRRTVSWPSCWISSTSITIAVRMTERRPWLGPRPRSSFVISTSRRMRRPIFKVWPHRSFTRTDASERHRKRSSVVRLPSRISGHTAFPVTCRSFSCTSTTSRTSPRFASCYAPMSTGA